jgi:hypothetical protein
MPSSRSGFAYLGWALGGRITETQIEDPSALFRETAIGQFSRSGVYVTFQVRTPYG